MDRALETVEIVGLATHDDLKGFVVVIPAMFANGHWRSFDPDSSNRNPRYSRLPKPEVSEHEQHNDDCSDNPDDVVRHDVLRVFRLSGSLLAG